MAQNSFPLCSTLPCPPRPGSETWMLLPTSEISGSATPRASTRSRIRSRAFSITVGSVPGGPDRTTETPPTRSSPRSGRTPVTNPPMAARTSAATRTMDAVSLPVPFISLPLQQRRSVDGELEPAVQPFGRPAAHHHPLEEDLEILHHVADLRVDRELERHGSGRRVYPEKRLFGPVVHPVVDVEVDLRRLSNPAPVDVGLVGQDHRGRDVAGSLPALLLVVPHGTHDQGEVGHAHPVLQHVVGEHRADLSMVHPGHHVPDVVEVAGQGAQVGGALVEVQPGEDVVRDASGQIGVAEAVLGEPEPLHHPIGAGDERRDLAVLLDLLQAEQPGSFGLFLRGRPLGDGPLPRVLAHGCPPASSSSSSCRSSGGSSSSYVTFRAMAERRKRTSTPSEISRMTSSSSSVRMVPYMPPRVSTSSPTARSRISSRCCRVRRCWGRMSRK